MTLLFDSPSIIESIFWSIFVSAGFAVLFSTPPKATVAAGILGGIGFGIKSICLHYFFIDQVILSTFFGASAIGLLGLVVAHYVDSPPIVFTIPAAINMIPGKYGYSFMMQLLNWVTETSASHDDKLFYALQTMELGFKTLFILLALSTGIIIPILLLNVNSAKNVKIIDKLKRK